MRAPLACLAVLLAGCGAAPSSDKAEQPAKLHAEVLQVIPHDEAAFTQGLELADGVLYEGTGLPGRSSVRATDPATGTVRARTELPAELFGEGITVVGPTIWQLTWRDGVAIQRDRASLAELRQVEYEGEGWGLCHDETTDRLIMSDGSERLTFRDPQNFRPTGEVRVSAGGTPTTKINELECANGSVFANIWQTDTVARIEPSTGRVSAEIDLSGLLPAEDRAGADVLNGIAAIPGTDEFLVTGKLWPKMFRVRFVAPR